MAIIEVCLFLNIRMEEFKIGLRTNPKYVFLNINVLKNIVQDKK